MDHIGSLKPDPRNARRHTSRNVGMITDAMHEVGAARSIVIDEDNVILAGNATIEAAAAAGIERLRIVDADGEEIIAVRRSGLTPEQKRRLALFDNRTAELAEWDEAVIASLTEDTDLSGLFADDELAAILARLEPAAGLTDPDDVPDPPADPVTQPGDLWHLGRHRLLCGDSTVATDVARLLDGTMPVLMTTDPPYGVEYGGLVASRKNQKQGGWDDIANDAKTDDEMLSMLTAALACPSAVVAFVWHPAGARRFIFWQALEANGWRAAQEIVWVKNALVFGRADYQWRHEPCIYAKRPGAPAQDDRTMTTVWEAPKPHDSQHPTQKPTVLFEIPIRNHSTSGDSIYDPFLGSGTTVIAAEQLGRTCYGMEISPTYCDVIVTRWQHFTGQTAARSDD